MDSNVDILSTTAGINDDDVGREISDCLDAYVADRDYLKATVRLLAVMAGSLQRAAETLADIVTAIDDK